ncbi:transketolase C-terminal domain-containing protein [Actinosynnema mirum]|uniref:Transketolase domain protein n=1 Tax=Actinosynnema mirum (strain ATCC 29888 / DSM 43827 / JCM 3225 / NBRC 14064 / NCIMB 13271 / NRRL B-12336 / IMRU 3971 / 101) TaxID=446462 RepID=C6WMX2_ACTMD|nr:transketolase C-terminal domain-containing protein [Actinosynnema mirum]ACU38485.1 Transketolase domain protein [Actinosynnema mirum DSM 43827]
MSAPTRQDEAVAGLREVLAGNRRVVVVGDAPELAAEFGRERVLASGDAGSVAALVAGGLHPVVAVAPEELPAYQGLLVGTGNPVVLRTAGTWAAHLPGVRLVAPANPADSRLLLAEAVRAGEPVVLVEPEHRAAPAEPRGFPFSAPTGPRGFVIPAPAAPGGFGVPASAVPVSAVPVSAVPECAAPECAVPELRAGPPPRRAAEPPEPRRPQLSTVDKMVPPLGRAAVLRSGVDVTVLAVGASVDPALRAADALAARRVDAEVVDVRSLFPLDLGTLAASARRTGRVVVVTEPWAARSAAELAAAVTELAFDDLLAPVTRLRSGAGRPGGPDAADVERAAALLAERGCR